MGSGQDVSEGNKWTGGTEKQVLPCEAMQMITREAEGELPFTSLMLAVGAFHCYSRMSKARQFVKKRG